jgi:predicted enzyme related to lactoylglutathione lyase
VEEIGMTKSTLAVATKPVWVELSSPDAAASRDFYAKLFGWNIEVHPDPQYGGYGIARIGGEDAAGIGPKQSPDAPTAWTIYIGTDDVDRLAETVKGAGGTVVSAPFGVGDQGRMAVLADPTGAIISAWQAAGMRSFAAGRPNTYSWAELNARGIDTAIRFYETVFGWTHTTSPPEGDTPAYTQFALDGENFAGAMEMNPLIPAETPSYWMPYFGVTDVDAAFQKALQLGGEEMVSPQDYPGGRFAIVSDPHGAAFGLMRI